MAETDEKTYMQKLAILLPHLLAHNQEHARQIEKWILLAGQSGQAAVAHELTQAALLMEKIDGHLTAAITLLGGHDRHEHP
ncbi:MAG: hypothetical protein PHC61_02235 [Chitinivibrionales bacterium]|nr:hypothetical protein [Chitinivibrionales bacterium]